MKIELTKKSLIVLRDGHPSDKNFIFATWLKGLRHGNDLFNFIDQEIYFRMYHQIIEALLKRPEVIIRMACLKDDPETILGYSVFQGPTLHWVFVKEAWRKIGLMRDLLPNPFEQVSHITKPGKAILMKNYPNVKFNPFL